MPLPKSLRGKIIAGSVVFALTLALAFTALLVTIHESRTAARLSERSEQVSTAANLLERMLLDLETGQRAYVITGKRSFLQPWEQALRRYPQQADLLRGLAADESQRRRIDELRRLMEAYVREWSRPVVDKARVDRDAAAKLVAGGGGKRRVDVLRARFDTFRIRQDAVSDARADHATATAQRASVIGLAGLAGTVLLVFLFAVYLVRAAIEPVEEVTRAARKLREGDRTARVRERTGADEASALTRDFNTMAATLARTLEDVGRQRSELEAVLDSVGEGITMTDPTGELVFSNERMESLWVELGMRSGGSIWERVARLAQLTPAPDSYGPAFAAIAADPEAVLEDDFDVPSLQRSFHGYTAPVRGQSGSVIGRLFSLRETTTERAAEQAKEQFLATVSHELRTPLTSIRGYLELVRDGEAGELTREQNRFLEIVDRSARNLHVLVDDLLTLGRSATAGLELELGEVELGELVAECVESAGTEAAEKRIAVRLDAEPGLQVRGDRRRLGQLATNLVGNAIKFTPMGGSIDVSARSDGGVASLEVADTGIGIPADEQERLFDRFFRASSAAAAQVPGTGLGLAISKEIVEAHGGSISVRSAEGAGTTFRVELPVGGPQ